VKRTPMGYFLAALVVALGTVVYRFPPQEYGFYPRCPVYAVTHLLCPGCGGTRAVFEMLHGNVAGAWHYNAFLTLLVPLTLVWLAFVRGGAVRSNQAPEFHLPGAAWVLIAAVAILFTVARNTGLAFVI
jgi:hypothetical protein